MYIRVVGLYDVYTNISKATDVVSKLLLWNHGIRAIRVENRTFGFTDLRLVVVCGEPQVLTDKRKHRLLDVERYFHLYGRSLVAGDYP